MRRGASTNWERILEQSRKISVFHTRTHILNDLLYDIRIEGATLRVRSLIGQLEGTLAQRQTMRAVSR